MFLYRCHTASRFVQKFAFWMAACGVVLTIAGTPARSYATPTSSAASALGPQHLWVYNSQNVLVDVTDTKMLGGDGHWYVTVDGQPIAVTWHDGHIYDMLANDIGVITA